MTPIILIAATDRNGAIGRQGQMPWSVPSELKHFKQMTSGHCLLMGRKTFQSLGKPLPNRVNLVLTNDSVWTADGIQVVHSMDEAVTAVKLDYPDRNLFIAGGGNVYAQTMNLAHSAIISRLDIEVYDADTYFPTFDRNWLLLNTEHFSDSHSNIAYSIERWVNTASAI